MYKCFETASIISILDVPQFVVDASRFSKTHTTPKPTTTTATTLSKTATDDSAPPPDETGGNNSGSAGANPDPASGPTTATPAPGSSNNTPIIVGSVVGGVAGLLLLLLLLFCLNRKAKGKLGLGFTRNKENKKEDNSSNVYHTTNLTAAAAKGRNSSGSETTAVVVPIPSQQQPQQYYYRQEQHHNHPQLQTQPQLQPQQLNVHQHQHQQPQYRGPVGEQQPISISHTVNEGASYISQPPSYPHSTSYTPVPVPVPATSSTSDASSRFVGGIVPIPYHSNETQQREHSQPQPYFQQQPQSQAQFVAQAPQQGIPPQVQPVNHIHVYCAPPTHQTDHGSSHSTSQFSSPTPGTHMRGGSGGTGSTVPDALGLFVQHPGPTETKNSGQDRSRDHETRTDQGQEQDNIPAYYGHIRDVSALSSSSRHDVEPPSPETDAEWLASRGPGYRQSM